MQRKALDEFYICGREKLNSCKGELARAGMHLVSLASSNTTAGNSHLTKESHFQHLDGRHGLICYLAQVGKEQPVIPDTVVGEKHQ